MTARYTLWLDAEGSVRKMGNALRRVFGVDPNADVVGTWTFYDMHVDGARSEIVCHCPACEHMRHSTSACRDVPLFARRMNGTSFPMRCSLLPIVAQDTLQGWKVLIRDCTGETIPADIPFQDVRVLTERALQGTLSEVLQAIVDTYERFSPHQIVSILLYDSSSGRLHHGGSRQLPADFIRMIDGSIAGPGEGSCGTAAFYGQLVVVADVAVDPLWRAYREAALSFGLRSCWSQPVLAADGRVLGTFATYTTAPGVPTFAEVAMLEFMSHLAALAIEREHSKFEVDQLAHWDALTNLPNRTMLWKQLAVRAGQVHPGNHGILFLDLDNFRSINDTLGHKIGDLLLHEFSNRLQFLIGIDQFIAHFGGDEFVAILHLDHTSLDRVCESILEGCREPLVIRGRNIYVTVSIGAVQCGLAGDCSPYDLVKRAETAMYWAKDRGGNHARQFHDGMGRELWEQRFLADELQTAIALDQLYLEYQPTVQVATDIVTGLEALVRWRHPEKGNIPPSVFIPFAEEHGMIQAIGDRVLTMACDQIRAWDAMGLPPLVVSVNVSPRQFRTRDFIDKLESTLRVHGVCPTRIQIEITETALMDDGSETMRKLETLASRGIKVAIDDFGIGYSSLSYLRRFRADTLKVDQSFVRDIGEGGGAIVSAVIALAHSLGLQVVAEGVEDVIQLEFVRGHGCDHVQGYLLARPMAADAVPVFMREWMMREPNSGRSRTARKTGETVSQANFR